MERIPIAIYTKGLREEAIKLVTEGGLRIPAVYEQQFYARRVAA